MSSAPTVPVILPAPLKNEVQQLLLAGDYYGAIRLARRRTGIGLVVAKRAVDAIDDDLPDRSDTEPS